MWKHLEKLILVFYNPEWGVNSKVSPIFDTLKKNRENPEIRNEFRLSGPGQLVPGDEALLEGEVPASLDPLSGCLLNFQPQLDGDDQHLEDLRHRWAHPGPHVGRRAPTDPRGCPRVSADLPEGQEDGQHEVLVGVEVHHHHRGPPTHPESRQRRRCQC